MTLTTRAHELIIVGRHALLMVTIDTTHSGRLQSAPCTRKYVKNAVFGTEPTNTRANGPIPAILQLHPPRTRWLHGTCRLRPPAKNIFCCNHLERLLCVRRAVAQTSELMPTITISLPTYEISTTEKVASKQLSSMPRFRLGQKIMLTAALSSRDL